MRAAQHTTALRNESWFTQEYSRRVSRISQDMEIEQQQVDLQELIMDFISQRRNGNLNIARIADDFAESHKGYEAAFSVSHEKWNLPRTYRNKVWAELQSLIEKGFISLSDNEVSLVQDNPETLERTEKVRSYLEKNGASFQGSVDKLAMSQGVGEADGSDLHEIVPVLVTMLRRGQLKYQDDAGGVRIELAQPYTRSWSQIKKEEQKGSGFGSSRGD